MFRIRRDLFLQGFADVDWVSDPDDRKFMSGYCVFFGGNLIQWASNKQNVIARSNTKAEYRSLAHVAADKIWLQSLFNDIGIKLTRSPTLWCGNLSVVHLSADPILHSHTKHVEIDIYFV